MHLLALPADVLALLFCTGGWARGGADTTLRRVCRHLDNLGAGGCPRTGTASCPFCDGRYWAHCIGSNALLRCLARRSGYVTHVIVDVDLADLIVPPGTPGNEREPEAYNPRTLRCGTIKKAEWMGWQGVGQTVHASREAEHSWVGNNLCTGNRQGGLGWEGVSILHCPWCAAGLKKIRVHGDMQAPASIAGFPGVPGDTSWRSWRAKPMCADNGPRHTASKTLPVCPCVCTRRTPHPTVRTQHQCPTRSGDRVGL